MDTQPTNADAPASVHDAQLVPRLQQAEQKLMTINQRTLAFVRAHPGSCVLGAVALGFIVGKIAARK